MIGRFDDWEKERDGGLMSKAGGLMSKAGSLKSRNGRTDGIDLLAERVAEVVKMEVLRFFQGGEG